MAGMGKKLSGENSEECVQIDKIRASLVEKWEPFYKKMKTPDASVRTYTEALYQYITANKIQEKLKKFTKNFEAEGNLSLVKRYSQIYEIVMNLLDKLVEILEDKKVRIRELFQRDFGSRTFRSKGGNYSSDL